MKLVPQKPQKLPRTKIKASLLSLAIGLFAANALGFQALAQAGGGLIEKLEGDADPTRDAKGRVVKHINPTDVIHWTVAGQNYDASSNKLLVTLALTTERKFTIYVDKLKFEPVDGWRIAGLTPPKSSRQFDPISRRDVDVYREGAFEITLEKTGSPDSADIHVTYVGCTNVICLFPHSEKLPVKWQNNPTNTTPAVVTAGEAQAASPPSNQTNSATAAEETGTVEEQFAQKVKTGHMSILTLLVIAFVGGLLTNLTPCVAPMIPITIRLLANQTVQPLASAAMYAGGIVATYTSLGVVAALSGALFGNLIAHPAVSITFGAVMFLLGINMLGFGDLTKLQQIGGRIGSSKGGLFNSFLMGAGAGLVASPCTGPILAALLTYTAGRQNTIEAVALLGIYSIGFALPYVFLGASAARISKVRVNFQIQILTKLVFASVMFGLSMYFLRLPLYSLFTAIKPYWGAIGAVGLILGLLLSAAVIMNEGLHHKKAVFLVPTIALGVGIFFGLQALTHSGASDGEKIVWLHKESEAIDAALKAKKPIIVDGWAEWCEACKKMDATTFQDPDVIKEISNHWIAVKFDLTEPTDENTNIQERYELPGLPTLTLLPPSGDLRAKFAISGYASAKKLLETLRAKRDSLTKAAGP